MSSSQQKALLLQGLNQNFELGTTEIYKPSTGELLVKLKSSALNPADWKMRYFDFGFMTYPAVLGTDMAGDVVEVGEGVRGFEVGDKVFFQGDFTNRNDGFQQYAVTPAKRTAKIPSNLSYDQAATIPLTLFTAWSGFYNSTQGLGLSLPNFTESSKGTEYANTPIVILGGASSVGQMAIQLAHLSNFSPIITTASPKNTPTLKSLGATHIIDRTLPLSSLPSQIAQITSQPITRVFDSISLRETAQAGYDLLAPGGMIVLVLPGVNVNEVEGTGKRVVVAFANVHAPPENVELVERFYGRLEGLLNRVEVIPGGLGGIVDGLKRLENGEVSAVKLVVHPDETV